MNDPEKNKPTGASPASAADKSTKRETVLLASKAAPLKPPNRDSLVTKCPPPATEIGCHSAPHTKAAAPIKPVGGSHVWSDTRPVKALPRFPVGFPPHWENRTLDVIDEASVKFPRRSQIIETCRMIVRKLEPIFVAGVKSGELPLQCARPLLSELFALFLGVNCASYNDLPMRVEAVEDSDEWRNFRRQLSAIETAPAASIRMAEVIVEGQQVRRAAAIDAYISEVFARTGKKITRTDIWRAARYTTRTEFEKWQRNDPQKVNKTAAERFARILTDEPHLKPTK